MAAVLTSSTAPSTEAVLRVGFLLLFLVPLWPASQRRVSKQAKVRASPQPTQSPIHGPYPLRLSIALPSRWSAKHAELFEQPACHLFWQLARVVLGRGRIALGSLGTRSDCLRPNRKHAVRHLAFRVHIGVIFQASRSRSVKEKQHKPLMSLTLWLHLLLGLTFPLHHPSRQQR